MSDLMPCPFCGSTKVGIAASQEMVDGKYIEEGRDWSVLCGDCGASCSTCCESEREATAMWNMRAYLDDDLTPDQIAWLRERAEATRMRWAEHVALQRS